MSIRKRGTNAYQVRVRGDGFLKVKTVPTREAARKLELDWRLKRDLGDLYEEPPSLFGAEIDGYLARKEATANLRPKTLDAYEHSASHLGPLRALRTPDVRRKHLDDLITPLARAHPKTAKETLQFAKAVLRDARSRGQRIDPAILDIPTVKHTPKKGRALSPDQLLELASFCPEYYRRFILLKGRIGFRVNEGFTLTDQHLDLDNGTMFIPESVNKARKDKYVPLTPAEVVLFREQLMVRAPGTALVFPKKMGSPMSYGTFHGKIWTPLIRAAGLDGFTPHHLRHTAISISLAAGMSPEQVAVRVGHNDGGALIMRTYRHLLPSELRPALARLDAFFAADVDTSGTEEVAGQ